MREYTEREFLEGLRYEDKFPDLSGCPYFRGIGTCESGCHQEPACIVDRPPEGWPGEQDTFPSSRLSTEEDR